MGFGGELLVQGIIWLCSWALDDAAPTAPSRLTGVLSPLQAPV